MTENEFNQEVDGIFLAIEEALEDSGLDVDYESAGGLLTITIECNGSQIILSRQPALAEIWVAAKSGGFHLGTHNGGWYCANTNENLVDLLNRTLSEQCGETVNLTL